MNKKTPRELAARALCQFLGLPEATKFEGKPMWQSMLPEVDIVLSAALNPDQWAAIKSQDDWR